MKKFTLILSCALLLTSYMSAQSSAAPPDVDMQKMMKNMMPGEVQKMMATRTGDWAAELTMYMDPTQPPQKQSAKVHNDMIMDRYLTSSYTGTMMGMPFNGTATLAYDNGTNKYYMSWLDNMSTGMTQLSGTYDEKTRTITLNGISQDPMTGMETPMRQTITYVDDMHTTMEMFGPGMNGGEMKMMEIRLTKM